MNKDYEEISKHLRLNEETGQLFWKIPGHGRIMGRPVGTRCGRGYLQLKINGKRYRGSHVVWLLHTGHWPADQLDHINRDTQDDRPVNLRESTQAENNYNMISRNGFGTPGIFQVKSGKYRAMLGRKLLGFYETAEEAISVRLKAEDQYLGEH